MYAEGISPLRQKMKSGDSILAIFLKIIDLDIRDRSCIANEEKRPLPRTRN